MEDRSPAALAVVNADGIGLQVQFRWMKDRHSHTINLLFENRTIPVLESLEGTDVEPWPESPPLQQLSIEELRPSTRAALLVGMAGQSHWSMSVEPNPAEMEFQFDVACRLRAAAGHLGTAYRLLSGGSVNANMDSATIDIDGRRLAIMCDRDPPAASKIKESSDVMRIEPKTIGSAGTTRWRYAVGLK